MHRSRKTTIVDPLDRARGGEIRLAFGLALPPQDQPAHVQARRQPRRIVERGVEVGERIVEAVHAKEHHRPAVQRRCGRIAELDRARAILQCGIERDVQRALDPASAVEQPRIARPCRHRLVDRRNRSVLVAGACEHVGLQRDHARLALAARVDPFLHQLDRRVLLAAIGAQRRQRLDGIVVRRVDAARGGQIGERLAEVAGLPIQRGAPGIGAGIGRDRDRARQIGDRLGPVVRLLVEPGAIGIDFRLVGLVGDAAIVQRGELGEPTGAFRRLHPGGQVGQIGGRDDAQQPVLGGADRGPVGGDLVGGHFGARQDRPVVDRHHAIRLRNGPRHRHPRHRLGEAAIALQRIALAAIGQADAGEAAVIGRVARRNRHRRPGRARTIGFERHARHRPVDHAAIALVDAIPVGIGDAGDGHGGQARRGVIFQRAVDHGRGANDPLRHLVRHLADILAARLRLRRLQHLADATAQVDRRGQHRRQVDTRTLIQIDRRLDMRPRRRAHRQREQRRSRRTHRQRPTERRCIAQVGQPGAGIGAVQPQGFAVHARAHQDMIERARRRQAIGQQVAQLAARQHGLRLDIQRAQDRQQQQGLRLAVAIAQLPRLRRALRLVIALVHAVEQIADLFLHQLQRRRRPLHRVAARRLDLRDLRGQRRIGGDQPVGRIERRHHLRHRRPVGKARRLQQPQTLEPHRYVIGQVGLLGQRQWHADLAIAADDALHRLGRLGIEFPAHLIRRRPQHAGPRIADLQRRRRQRLEALHRTLQHRVLARDRDDDMQDIADAQPLHRHRRGQHAVQLALFQLLFATQHVEPRLSASRVRLQQVDTLGPADDLGAVDDQVARRRLPLQADRPRLPQHFGRRDPRRGIGILPHRAALQPLLAGTGWYSTLSAACAAQLVDPNSATSASRRIFIIIPPAIPKADDVTPHAVRAEPVEARPSPSMTLAATGPSTGSGRTVQAITPG
ncbi:hypothetical protein WR25_02401 [Diploscapter pachys]|uniref:Uncharacterized protein n=1 Tax=Diploscapter pachys TaxID=2018661 RepID=A0A2A2KHA9_9BILA|nr:hypothetical protein WR25_02401 [Diploscapter pachys]